MNISDMMYLERGIFGEKDIFDERYLDLNKIRYAGLWVRRGMNPVGYKYP
jgi:hypothetical protein